MADQYKATAEKSKFGNKWWRPKVVDSRDRFIYLARAAYKNKQEAIDAAEKYISTLHNKKTSDKERTRIMQKHAKDHETEVGTSAAGVKEENDNLDDVNSKALNKKFKNRKDKDIDNDGDVDSSDEYLHKRRKAIKKNMQNEKYENYSDKEVRMATGIAKQNHDSMTIAVNKIEKIKKGLSDHPEVKKALRRYNEEYEVTPKTVCHESYGYGEVLEASEDNQLTVLFESGVQHVSLSEVTTMSESRKAKKESDKEVTFGVDDQDDDYEDDIQRKNKKNRKQELVGQKEETESFSSQLIAAAVNALREKASNGKRVQSNTPADDFDVEREADKDIKDYHRKNTKIDDTDEKGHDDATKAGKVTKPSPARGPADNLNTGDKKPKQ